MLNLKRAAQFLRVLAVVLAVLVGGCTKRDYGVETFPVTGVVCIDGSPTGQVSVTLHRVGGMDRSNPTVSATVTKDDGSFAVSTFEHGDGVPAGDYVATFTWAEFNAITRSRGADKLGGKYDKPEQSAFKVTVASGVVNDMGRIELTTK
ncbi:MAG: hypothetical protein MUF48_25230 [Pirellulaceae bacterium]|jgi:hypothetical protein|nr:hypothetical protein [Pirellulaceae bacterium]